MLLITNSLGKIYLIHWMTLVFAILGQFLSSFLLSNVNVYIFDY